MGPDRLPPLPESSLSPAHQRAAAELATGPRGAVFGPFVPLLRSPDFLSPLQKAGEYLRYKSALPPRLSEFAILIVARRWNQQFRRRRGSWCSRATESGFRSLRLRPRATPLPAASVGQVSFEANRFYQPGLLEAPELWLWEGLASGATRAKSFTLSGVDAASSQAAALDVYLQGASESGNAIDHHVSVSVNGVAVGEAQFAGKKPYRLSLSVAAGLLREGANELQLANVPDSGVSSYVFLDRFTIAHPQSSTLAGGRFSGEWPESGSVSLQALGAVSGPCLLMVFFGFILDDANELHWLGAIEKKLASWGKLESIELTVALCLLLVIQHWLPAEIRLEAMVAGVSGVILFVMVDSLDALFEDEEAGEQAVDALKRSGLMSFLYLEVLDASFSFDGVIGAFAITQDVIIIMLGLAIGAMFVRSLTVYLVRQGTLDQYVFLEHGAHYAIGVLAGSRPSRTVPGP